MAIDRVEKTKVGLMDRSSAGIDKGQTTGREVNNQEGQRACGYRPKGWLPLVRLEGFVC